MVDSHDARQQLLGTVAEATEHLGRALALLGEAYEALDEHSGDVLEAELFGPVQKAYGRLRKVHAGFAERHRLEGRDFDPPPAGRQPSAKLYVEAGVSAVHQADSVLSTLQDSMLPVEIGDPELRAGLTEVRALVGGLSGRARELLRRLGR